MEANDMAKKIQELEANRRKLEFENGLLKNKIERQKNATKRRIGGR
jgi:hypothetical protein